MGKSGGKKNARNQVKAGQRKARRLSRDNPNMLRRVRDKELVAPDLGSFRSTMDARGRAETAEESAAKARRRAEKRAEMIALGLAPADGDDDEIRISNAPEGKRKWYFRELMKVIEASDVIIQVLDARDPLGCRALDVERRILAQQTSDGAPSKRLVLVLNKIDLVPPPVVADWVAYLRREHPTVAFKSSTGGGRGHLAALDVKASKASAKALDTRASVGGQALLQLLKNYSRSLDVKKGLTVGIIGYPNVGKSSIINSLKMARAVQVSSAAGCTKSLQQVRLDSNIMLVDSPGVLFAADDAGVASSADALTEDAVRERTQSLLLRNVLRVDQIADPIVAVQGIMARCTPEQLQSIYGVAEYSSDREFLYFVAHRMGKIGKGGIPNLEEAARVVLKDWNAGKIPFYTTPPAVEDVRESTLMSGFSESFDVAGLLDAANNHAVQVIREGAAAKGGEIMGGDDNDDDEDNDDNGEGGMGEGAEVADGDDEDEDDSAAEEEDDVEITEALSSAIATASAGMADGDADVDALLASIAPDAFARVGRSAAKAEKAFNGRTTTAAAAAAAASAARRPATSAMESIGRLISTRTGRSKAYKVTHDEAYQGIPATARNNKAALKKAKKDQRRAAAAAAGGYAAGMDDGLDF